ncbi:MAG: 16S rRNA (guanine(527)-N(7))-methyltransferase RsmG [Gammaproteobacteria bacterium]|nr:16S rRNA (guanine(527)-N(7))-methyltransferase RsmG [Gammaproteobacteria bacterium]
MEAGNKLAEDQLREGLEVLGVGRESQQIEQLFAFIDLLQHWNGAYNLVADSRSHVIVGRHILDSLSISAYLNDMTTVIDVGTGAGFPGIPLAIAHPDTYFILLDANGKKTRFLFQVKTTLGLTNVGIENCRAEHYHYQRPIDLVVCRALASLSVTVEKIDALLRAGAHLLAMKGRLSHKEIDALPTGYNILATDRVWIPGDESERHVILLKKLRHIKASDCEGK